MLVERTAEALRAHGLLVTAHDGEDAALGGGGQHWLRVGKGAQRIDYLAAVKHRLTRGTLGAVVMDPGHPLDMTQQQPPLLLITDHVTPAVAEQLRRTEQQFADLAGNAYLEGRGLYVFVSGRKLDERAEALRTTPRFAQARLKVLSALICDPALAAAPYGAIAAVADVALGLMPVVVADLQRSGALVITERQRTLNCERRLLDEWAEVYAVDLRSRTLAGRYRAESFASWPEWSIAKAGVRWGGEPAAVLLGGELVPTVLTVYGERLPRRLIADQHLVPAGVLDYENLLEVRKPFWKALPGGLVRADCAPPALVYADLLATGSARCQGEAQSLYERWLARVFPEVAVSHRRVAAN